MTFRLVSRETIGLDPVVRSSSGSARPKVRVPVAYFTWHWTGVNVRWGDVGDTAAEIRSIEDYARRAGKPNEYNFVIHQDPDNLVHEYAGEFRAAHSGGENSISYGTLFLNGIQEPITELQIQKAQWLSGVIGAIGGANQSSQHRGHQQMPGAATQCPGPTIMAALSRFDDPVGDMPKPELPKPPTNPVPVDPPDDLSGVGYFLVTSGKSPWSISAETYGTGTRWDEIMDANDPDETPNPGERWLVPGFRGQWTTVRRGEGPWGVLERLFGSGGWNHRTGVDQFWQWNGGDPALGGRDFGDGRGPRPLQVGERVWVRS